MMAKLVINDKLGGYALSPIALVEIYKRDPASKALELFEIDKPAVGQTKLEWIRYVKEYGTKVADKLYAMANRSAALSVRSDDALVDVVSALGKKAFGPYTSLKVVTVATLEGVSIKERAGNEYIKERM